MLHNAVLGKHYDCYLSQDTMMPFVYIDDLVSETVL